MEIHSAINMRRFSPRGSWFMASKYLLLRYVDFIGSNVPIASKTLKKSPKVNSYKEVDGNASIRHPPLHKQIATLGLVGNQIARPKLSPVKYDDASFDLLHTTDRNNPPHAMNSNAIV